jgi:hypothetical protein
MIKQIGTLGFFIRFNESASSAFKFVEIFSSSAATESLFSASTSSTNRVQMSTSGSYYLNGITASTIYSDEWAHVMFTFDPKLTISGSSNFLLRLGNETKADFQVQNLYMLDFFLDSGQASAMHGNFVGNFVGVSASATTASPSIRFVDLDEARHSSSITRSVYQPVPQTTGSPSRLGYDVTVAASMSLSGYVSASPFARGALFQDGVVIEPNNYILSLVDNQIYQYNSALSKLVPVSTSVGWYVNILSGIQFEGRKFLKTSSSFSPIQIIEKLTFSGPDLV